MLFPGVGFLQRRVGASGSARQSREEPRRIIGFTGTRDAGLFGKVRQPPRRRYRPGRTTSTEKSRKGKNETDEQPTTQHMGRPNSQNSRSQPKSQKYSCHNGPYIDAPRSNLYGPGPAAGADAAPATPTAVISLPQASKSQ